MGVRGIGGEWIQAIHRETDALPLVTIVQASPTFSHKLLKKNKPYKTQEP